MRKNIDHAKMIIRFYNDQCGCSIKTTDAKLQETVFTCLERIGGDPIYIKNHIRKWVAARAAEGPWEHRAECFEECLEAIEVPRYAFKSEEENLGSCLDVIGKAVADVVSQTQADQISEKIMASLQAEVRDFISREYGPLERKITVLVNDHKSELTGVLHKKFDEVLGLVKKDIPVFLVGPAGSGKNVLCKQIAEALGLKFYFTNAVTQEYKLTGFTDAMGNYQPTQFYKAFTEGGIFMLDELDASIPEVLNILNAAIANRYFDFPAPIGYVEAHPDFKVIAAGNTTGHGADYQYVGRNQLDGASLDRFVPIHIDYCEEIENNVAKDINLANFCRAFRAAAKKVGVGVIVSYRGIGNLANILDIVPLEEAIKICLVKDLEKDDVRLITNELPSSEYKTALEHIQVSM